MALWGIEADLLAALAIALGIGGLIGLERERHHKEKAVLAGVRTMPLVSMSGVLLVVIAEVAAEPLLLVAGVAVFGGLAWFMARGKEMEGATGLTTPVAFVATFLLGVLVGYGQFLFAIVGAVATTMILFHKERLHHFADILTGAELRSATYFIAIAFILYPIAPDAPIGPGGVVNLQQVLLIVILVSVVSFLGFLAMRRYGPRRGVPAIGFLGGLASSVAAAAAVAALPLRTEALRHAASLGILAAAGAMLVRNLAIAAIVDPSLGLATALAVPFFIVGAVVVAAVLRSIRRRPRPEPSTEEAAQPTNAHDLGIRSPFAVGPALRFGVLFLALTVAAHLLAQVPGLGFWGVYLTAAGGLVATGPVVASMALLYQQGTLDLGTAASVALVGAGLSLGVKAGIARGAGPQVAGRTVPVLIAAGVVAFAAAVAVPLLL